MHRGPAVTFFRSTESPPWMVVRWDSLVRYGSECGQWPVGGGSAHQSVPSNGRGGGVGPPVSPKLVFSSTGVQEEHTLLFKCRKFGKKISPTRMTLTTVYVNR